MLDMSSPAVSSSTRGLTPSFFRRPGLRLLQFLTNGRSALKKCNQWEFFYQRGNQLKAGCEVSSMQTNGRSLSTQVIHISCILLHNYNTSAVCILQSLINPCSPLKFYYSEPLCKRLDRPPFSLWMYKVVKNVKSANWNLNLKSVRLDRLLQIKSGLSPMGAPPISRMLNCSSERSPLYINHYSCYWQTATVDN